MLKNANFLLEIGTEEIPTNYIDNALKNIKDRFSKKLTEEKIDFEEIAIYATPRRFVVMASGLAEKQREEQIERKGPAADKAFVDGKPSKALQGFMKANGVTEENLIKKQTDKGEYVFVQKIIPAKATKEIIPAIVEDLVVNTPFPKKMKWGERTFHYPRPIRYFLIMFNNEVIPFEIAGIKSDNKTRGHYIKTSGMIEVKNIADYEDILEKNYVILDQDKRKELIRQDLAKATKKINGILIEDEDLLTTVTYIVEYPNVVICEFAEEFLSLPDVVLITEMKENQKNFAVTGQDGKLLPYFLVVSNNPETEFIKDGNRRVLTARFNDGKFFFDEDRKQKLEARVDSLKNVLFHKDLGSIYQKVERVKKIAEVIASQLNLPVEQKEKIERAALLCKADLETAMVFEFTSLQGKMGKIYAELDGEPQEVANAIEDHYSPRFQGDKVPTEMVSVIISLAEKIDNLFGSYSVGNIPKGSQDPYALRRQSHAIVQILIENKINLDLRHVFAEINGLYKNGAEYSEQIMQFILVRGKTLYADAGFLHDEIAACLAVDNSDLFETFRKLEDLHQFRTKQGFSEMLLGVKRMNNLMNSFYKKNKDYQLSFEVNLLVEEAEKNLYYYFSEKKEELNTYIQNKNYQKIFTLLYESKTVIDGFFDSVMVMVDETKIRDNRLGLLKNILGQMENIADFSLISDK